MNLRNKRTFCGFANVSAYVVAALMGRFPAGAFADTHYVSTNGAAVHPYTNQADAARNIQPAVGAASDGDTVLVGDGVYTLNASVVVTSAVTILGQHGMTSTAVNGRMTDRCFTLLHAGAVLDGLTITNGEAWHSATNNSGGGVYGPLGGTIRNCMVVRCIAWGGPSDGEGYAYGGGIYLAGTGRIENCVIVENSASGGATTGGGIYGEGIDVIRCTIRGNAASAGVHGNFYGCDANSGGIRLDHGRIEECTVVSNSATAGGGMYYVGSASAGGVGASSSVVARCVIAANVALGGGSYYGMHGHPTAYGGGLSAGHCRIENCLVAGNWVGCSELDPYSSGGGGISAYRGRIVNCTIVSNTAYAYYGGGLRLSGATAENCIVYFNRAEELYSGETLSNCFVDAASIAYSCTAPDPGGPGNVTEEPAFVDRAGGDYHLTQTSPCIDAGTADDAPPVDLEGIPRPLDGNHDGTAAWDIGAYEFVHALADSDHDGLRDTNEIAGLTSAVLFDTDGDGMGDGAESAAGTDPVDAESFFDVSCVESTNWTADGIVIRWSSTAGRQYTLSRSTNLVEGFTELQTHIPAAAPANAFTDTTATAEGPYLYRVRLE